MRRGCIGVCHITVPTRVADHAWISHSPMRGSTQQTRTDDRHATLAHTAHRDEARTQGSVLVCRRRANRQRMPGRPRAAESLPEASRQTHKHTKKKRTADESASESHPVQGIEQFFVTFLNACSMSRNANYGIPMGIPSPER